MRPRFAAPLVALACAFTPGHAGAESNAAPRLRTSLVWIWGDDDVLHAPTDSEPPSPGPGIGDRAGYDGLFEGFASRYTGRENRSEVRLEGEAPGLLPRLTTRAGLALGLELGALGERAGPLLVADLGSFVEARWSFGAARDGRENAVTLSLLPINGDRERVGELEALAWGGAVGPRWESPYAAATGPVRAGRVELALGFARAHVGLKTASFLEPQAVGPSVSETSYGVHAGVDSRWAAPVAVALGFGHFEHGRLPGAAGSPRAATSGVSLRVSFGVGLERPRPPVAFLSDGSPFDRLTPPPKRHAFALGLEAAHLVQRLWSSDHPGESVLEPARAAAASAELRTGVLDLRAALIAREPSFVMRNAPGVLLAQSVPHDAAQAPELGILASAGLLLPAGFSPSLSAGVLWPASVTLQAVDRQGQVVGGTLIVRGPGEVEALPPGEAPVPVLDLRPALELRLSRLLEVVGWLDYRRDFNRTHLISTPEGTLERGFRSPDRLGYGVAARAVW
ncbi:MAG TPA: hypothetical protein VFV94_17770 [Polyangiaceae bacterium]|nr:hypothetical protein [Polyangiaceae bacterium]